MKHTLHIGAILLLPLIALGKNEKKLHYGISLGAQQSEFKLAKYNSSYYKSLQLNAGSGYRLGLVAGYDLSKTLSVNIKPEVAFYGCTINTTRSDNATAFWRMAPIAEIAADIRYKMPLKVVQPYIYAGSCYGRQLSGNDPNDMHLKNNFAVLELGLGIEKKVGKVAIAPEVRYSRTLTYAGRVCNMAGINMNSLAFIVNITKI